MKRQLGGKYKVTRREVVAGIDTVAIKKRRLAPPKDSSSNRLIHMQEATNDIPEIARSAFSSLPIEMNQRIADFLESDRDLDNFRRSCRAAWNAVDGDHLSFWRRRFLTTFDSPMDTLSNVEYKRRYLWRKDVLNKGARFRFGHDKAEENCMEVLRTLILEAFPEEDGSMKNESKNLGGIIRFVNNHDLLQGIFNPKHAASHEHRNETYRRPTEPLLRAIQIVLSPVLLDLAYQADVFQYPETQRMAYASANQQPIFGGSNGVEINMEWLLHQVSFWRYHMTREDEQTLYDAYLELTESEKPQFWNKRLRRTRQPEVGRYWKGSYGYLEREDVERVRKGHGEHEQIQDEFCGEPEHNLFQDMILNGDTQSVETWNPIFEQILRSVQKPTPVTRTRAQKHTADLGEIADWMPRSFRFKGDGADDEEKFLADGWLNPLPPQQGIPGWQRATFMKYFEDDAGNIDYNALWAYEGVVLPGGQIVIGRWWCPVDGEGDNMYCGPFLLWCVDGPKSFIDGEREASQEL